MKCKDCIFYKPKSRQGIIFKYGHCKKINDSPTLEDLGLKYIEDEGECFVVDSKSALDKILFDGGHYDSVFVGEDFGCIHFEKK